MMLNKKKLSLTLVCAAVIAVTGCSEDTEYVKDPQQQELIDKLLVDNANLEADNQSLEADNAKLKEQTETFVSNFQEQCASIGVDFDYVDPNDDSNGVHNGVAPLAVSSLITPYAAPSIPSEHDLNQDDGTCFACHFPSGGHYDSGCQGCHDVASTDPQPPVPTPDPGEHQSWVYTHPADGEWYDGSTGATTKSTIYYDDAHDPANGKMGSSSFVNADYLNSRFGKMFTFYEWKEVADASVAADETASSLAQACAVTNREHTTHEFPNDGKNYTLAEYTNFKGIATFATARLENGEVISNTAIFGPGMEKSDDGEFYVSLSIGKNQTCMNIIDNGNADIHYVEYNTRSNVKEGLPEYGVRNAGARIKVDTAYDKSTLKGVDWTTPIYGDGGSEGNLTKDTVVDWSKVGACTLKLQVKTIYPLG